VVGRNVRRLRSERQLELSVLAQRAGLAMETPANLESGEGNPRIETLFAASRALGVGRPGCSPSGAARFRPTTW
jgi:transcriptional regulator with XRE-family HTH domain